MKLEHLDLWSNNLSYFPAEMNALSRLKVLDLRGINLNREEQDYIKNLVPNTKVHLSPSCDCAK